MILLATCFHDRLLFGSFFDPEDGSDMFLRKDDSLSTKNMVLYPKYFVHSKGVICRKYVETTVTKLGLAGGGH
jgi:hypothetical protein